MTLKPRLHVKTADNCNNSHYASNNGMYIKHDNVRMKGIVLDLHDVNLNKLPYIGHFSVLTQNKIRHFITRYCNDLDIKLVFSCFKIGNLFGVKDPVPSGLRSCVV